MAGLTERKVDCALRMRSMITLGATVALVLTLTGIAPASRPPAPTPEYSSLKAVRDSVLALVLRAVTPGDTAIHVTSGPTRFKYLYLPDSTSGYAVRVAVTDTSRCPVVEIESALEAAHWLPHNGYSADGPDGTVMGYVTKNYLCVLEGAWDGGDDSDSTYVPAPGCTITVTCVARRQDDSPKD